MTPARGVQQDRRNGSGDKGQERFRVESTCGGPVKHDMRPRRYGSSRGMNRCALLPRVGWSRVEPVIAETHAWIGDGGYYRVI